MKANEEVFKGVKLAGIPMLLFNLAFLIGTVVFMVWLINSDIEGPGLVALIITDVVLFIINMLFWGGFMQIEPNEARVMIF